MSNFDENFQFYLGESKTLKIRVNVKSGSCGESLGIDPAALAPASLTVGAIVYQALMALGNTGNNLKLELVAGGTAGAEVVTITDLPYRGKLISVKIQSGVTTAQQIVTKIQAMVDYGKYFTVSTAAPTTAQVASASAPFAGGIGDQIEIQLSAEPDYLILTRVSVPAVIIDNGPLSKIHVDLSEIETNKMINGAIVVRVIKTGKMTTHVVEGGALKLSERSC